MAYQLPENWSIESMIDYCTATIAALRATPELAPLAEPWVAKRTELRSERQTRDDARDAVTEAAAVLRVADAGWDWEVTNLSSAAYQAARKDAGKPPYAQLFGTIKATQAVKFGAAKAGEYAEGLIARGTALDHADLTAPLAAFVAATERLGAAGRAHRAARVQAQTAEIRRVALHGELEGLVALTELGVLTRFVGRDDLVRAVLAPSRSRPGRPATAVEVVPDPVESDADL